MGRSARGSLRALRERLGARWRPAERRAQRAPWELADPLALAGDLGAIVADPDATVRRWLTRAPVSALYLHKVVPQVDDAARRRTRDLLAGRLRVHTNVPLRQEHLPPDWAAGPGRGRTEEMYRHALTWLEPLVAVAHVDDDRELWRTATAVVASWIRENAAAPGRSPGAWHDHAVSLRVRVLCWLLELYRQSSAVDEAFVRLVIASIHQHGLFLADASTHGARSNHALEAAGSLLSVCIYLPELRTAGSWSRTATERIEVYVTQAFADDGFSKEQSPRYHLFILRRLMELVSYLDHVKHPVPVVVRRRARRAAEVWPWLIRADGSLPRIGDTNERPVPHWRRALTDSGGDLPPAAPSSQPNPRSDDAALLAPDGGIYAVLRGHHPDDGGADDTHVVLKTDYFRFPHFHHDGLSFTLYALGREWLIDPGPHSYEYDRWERRYLCSSSAHNVVEVDGPFDVHPLDLVTAERTAAGDRVVGRHHLDRAVHTRAVEHRPPRRVHLRDEIVVTDGTRHTVRQLFQVAGDCDVERPDVRTVAVVAPSGARCVITQRGPGAWRIVRGQREPETLGWHSPRALTIEPTATCVFELATSAGVVFETEIVVRPAGP